MTIKRSSWRDEDSSRHRRKGNVGTTSVTLIARMQNEESDSWNQFMDLYTPLIRHWCNKPGGKLTRFDRQDITQTVLVKVNKTLKKANEKTKILSLRAWLRTVTKNAVADYFDANAKHMDVMPLASDTGSIKQRYVTEESSEPEDDTEEKLILLRQVLKRVEKKCKKEHLEIFHLLVVAEKTAVEIAKEKNLHPGTVRNIQRRMLKRIREEYATLGIEDELPE